MQSKQVTLYSSKDLKSLYSYFKSHLDSTYECLTPAKLNDLIQTITLISIALQTPHLAQELNQTSDISFVALLEILMTKAAMWKVGNAQELRKVVMGVLRQFKRLVPGVKIKQVIAGQIPQPQPIKFFVQALQDSWEQKLRLFVSFLRIHIMTVAEGGFGSQWCPLVDALISVVRRIDNFQLIDSVITIVSWLNQKNDVFKEQCLQAGLAYFLVTVVDRSEVNVQFRKKCLQFIKNLVKGNSQAIKSLKEAELENKCKVFVLEHPFSGIQLLVQPILQMIFEVEDHEGIQTRVQGISELMKLGQIPSEMQCCARVIEFIIYAPLLREFIDMGILANNIAELLQQHSNLEQFTVAVGVKALQKYLQIDPQPKESREQILPVLFATIISILSQKPERLLTYQSLKTLTVLLKKPFSRDRTLSLIKQYNLKQYIPKQAAPQDIAMLIIIDQVLWLMRERKEIKVEQVVSAITKGQGSKLEKTQQTIQRLGELRELIKQGREVDVQTINTVVGMLSTKKNLVLAQNSQQQQIQQKLHQNQSQILSLLQTALQSPSAMHHLSSSYPINRLVQFLPTSSDKSQVLLSLSLIDQLLPRCTTPESIEFEKMYEVVTEVQKQFVSEREVVEVAGRVKGKCPDVLRRGDEEEENRRRQQEEVKRKDREEQEKRRVEEERKKQEEAKKELLKKKTEFANQAEVLEAIKGQNPDQVLNVLKYLQEKPVDSTQVTKQLVKIFLESEKIKGESQNLELTKQIEAKIVLLLSKHDLKFDDSIKKLINKNKKGLQLCLILKGHSKEVIDACFESICRNPQDCSLQLKILYESLKTKADFEYFELKKFPEKINEMNIKDEQTFENASLLVGKSSKLRSIQQKYKMVERLIEGLQKVQSSTATAAIIYALCGLSYQNEPIQKQLLEEANLKLILSIADSDEVLDPLVIQRCAQLISNLSIKNQSHIQTLISHNTIQILMKSFKRYTTLPLLTQPIKQLLRALGNLALLPASRLQILSLDYVPTMCKLVTLCRPDNVYETMCYSLDVLANLTIQTGPWEEVARRVILEGGFEEAIAVMKEHLMNGEIVKSGLDCVENLVGEVKGDVLVCRGVCKLLTDVLRAHMWNSKIVTKVFRIINKLASQPLIVENMLEVALPKVMYEVTCQNKAAIDEKVQSQFYNITTGLLQSKKKELLLSSGALNCLVAVLKLKSQKPQEVTLLLKLAANIVKDNMSTSSINREMCQSTLQVMKNQTKQSENLVAKGLNLLFLLERDIVIDNETCKALMDFSSYFLTRSKKIVYETYEYRVRDFFCLLSILISRSSLLRIQMNDQTFMSIIQNWQKIAKAVETQGLYEAIKLCCTCVMNIEKLVGEDSEMNQQMEKDLEQGTKCLLYRRDQTSKQAKIAVVKGELVAHKFPDGPIKDKYRLPLARVLTIVSSFKSNEKIFEKSIFHNAGGVFRRPPSVSHCVSIAGYNAGQAKYFDVEFNNIQLKDKFVNALKTAIKAEKAQTIFSQAIPQS